LNNEQAVMLNTKGMRFPIDVILVCIRWYAAYPLSYRHIEEMMQEHGVAVDHSSINRWAVRFLPLLGDAMYAVLCGARHNIRLIINKLNGTLLNLEIKVNSSFFQYPGKE
jgi:transposase-like protein